nr:MAG TPA: hypothetical protein [Caudoviricetes sp.]
MRNSRHSRNFRGCLFFSTLLNFYPTILNLSDTI